MNTPCIINVPATPLQMKLDRMIRTFSRIGLIVAVLTSGTVQAADVSALTASSISEWLGMDISQQGDSLQAALEQFSRNHPCTENRDATNQQKGLSCTLVESNKTSPTELSAIISLDNDRVKGVIISCNNPAIISTSQLNSLKQLYLNVLKQRDSLSFYEFNEEYRQRNNTAISEISFSYSNNQIRTSFSFERSQCQISYQLIN